jgi:hypothetical protein
VAARRFAGIAVLLAFLGSARAAGAGGWIAMTWDDCQGDRDMQSGCLTNDGAIALQCWFQLDQPVMDVIGIEADVDVQTSGSILPDWWQLGPGQCRDGDVRVSGDFSALGACADPWRDLGEGQALFYPGLPRGGANQAHFAASYAVRSDSARTLDAGTLYYGIQLLISNDRTIFPGNCAGCGTPACLVLNSVRLLRHPSDSPPVVTLDTPGAGNANRATWHGDGEADCIAVPVRARTWGQIKALYQ